MVIIYPVVWEDNNEIRAAQTTSVSCRQSAGGADGIWVRRIGVPQPA
jgi:hypothetical protein